MSTEALLPRTIENHGADIVHTRRGHVAHVLTWAASNQMYETAFTLCGFRADDRSSWLGPGSYQEWEQGRRRPLCANCLRVIRENDLFGYVNGEQR